MKKLVFLLWVVFLCPFSEAKALKSAHGIKKVLIYENIYPLLEKPDDINMNEGDSISVAILACDGNNDPITLHTSGLPGFVSFKDNGNGSGLLILLPLINDSGRYSDIKIYVNDDRGGADTVSFNIVVSKVLYRVNAGGMVEPDQPIDWELDKQSDPSPYLDTSSYNHTTGSNVWEGENNTNAPDNIFGSNRYNLYSDKLLKWNFPVSNGMYEVNLYFAEKNNFVSGARKFKVQIEDEVVLNNFDIYAEAGKGALKKTFIIPVADDTLNILLDSILNYPQINGIEIIALEDDFPFVHEDTLEVDARMVPNPVVGKVVLQFSEYIRGSVSIILYNAKGGLCYTRTQQVGCGKALEVDIAALGITEGIYYLRVSSENIQKTFKLVKSE